MVYVRPPRKHYSENKNLGRGTTSGTQSHPPGSWYSVRCGKMTFLTIEDAWEQFINVRLVFGERLVDHAKVEQGAYACRACRGFHLTAEGPRRRDGSLWPNRVIGLEHRPESIAHIIFGRGGRGND